MRTVAMLPTYNESGNIEDLISQILSVAPSMEVVVVDDDSPDGTWKLVEVLATKDDRVHLIRRINKRGRGTAGRDGFIWARNHGYDAVVEMDADFSHDPSFIPSLLEPIRNRKADIVIGSRLMQGGGEQGRPLSRRLLTSGANAYIRILLRLPVRDCTSGFRVFGSRAMKSIAWEDLKAIGPETLQEILLAARRQGLAMTERPILFHERRAGTSTFNRKIMVNSLVFVLRNALKR